MKNKEFNLANYVCVGAAVLLLMFFLFGCTTERKATRYFNEHGYKAAQYCAAAFPVKTDSVFLPGKPIIKSDTTFLPGDSIPCPPQKPGAAPPVVHCPPSLVIRDTIIQRDTLRITKENPAKDSIIAGQAKQISEQGIRLQIAEDKASHRGWLMWGTWVVLAVAIAGWIFVKSKSAVITTVVNQIKNKLKL